MTTDTHIIKLQPFNETYNSNITIDVIFHIEKSMNLYEMHIMNFLDVVEIVDSQVVDNIVLGNLNMLDELKLPNERMHSLFSEISQRYIKDVWTKSEIIKQFNSFLYNKRKEDYKPTGGELYLYDKDFSFKFETIEEIREFYEMFYNKLLFQKTYKFDTHLDYIFFLKGCGRAINVNLN